MYFITDGEILKRYVIMRVLLIYFTLNCVILLKFLIFSCLYI